MLHSVAAMGEHDYELKHDYELGSAIWKERGAVWIPQTAADFFKTVKHCLETRALAEDRESIMRRFRLRHDDEQAYDDFIAGAAETLYVDGDDAEQFLLATLPRSGGAK